jgi:hypothetical protein
MTQEHPITPPPELVTEWWNKCTATSDNLIRQFATQAARWGADQELEACCAWLPKLPPWSADDLRRHRRPKPPSLKAGAIEVLDELDGLFELPAGHYNTILRALEQLDDSL